MLKLIQAFKNCITQIPSSSKLYIEALTNSLALIDYYLKLSDDRIIQRICKTFDFFSKVKKIKKKKKKKKKIFFYL